MLIESIAIGSELLTTDRLDTNSVWMAQQLEDLGLSFHRKSIVGDDPEDLRACFQEALDRSDLIICTGGLGPTFDDLTKEIWAQILNRDLIEDAEQRAQIDGFFKKRQLPTPPNNYKQALIPEGAIKLTNPVGTAPGLDFHLANRKRVILLPGVPREMQALWTAYIHPSLPKAGAMHTLRLLTAGVGESAVDERVKALRAKHKDLQWTILAHLGQVELRARATSQEKLDEAQKAFTEILGPDLVGVGPITLEGTVLDLLRSRNESLGVAESVTGGRIASLLSAIPGASDVFKGGAIVYSAAAKMAQADVSAETIEQFGTVSKECTEALARGIRQRLQSTYGLAVTGNAGPALDKEAQANLGDIFIAVDDPQGTKSWQLNFQGERSAVQHRSAIYALDYLRRTLQA